MPNRLVRLTILIGWTYASLALLVRDVLPDWVVGPPPDLRVIVQAEQARRGPVRWALLVVEDEEGLDQRSVGQVETRTQPSRDGWCRLCSFAWFDSEAMLRSTPLASLEGERIEVRGVFDVDPSGNLDSFRASVSLHGIAQELLVLSGKVMNNDLMVRAQGAVPLLNWTRRFPYQPRQMLQNELGPLDRMPGLQVGQRWRIQSVSPLTGRVEEAQVAVERRKVITWDSNPVTTLEVVTRVPPMVARTWVRPDGQVLRQEVPFPFVRLVLERLPDRFIGPDATDSNASETR